MGQSVGFGVNMLEMVKVNDDDIHSPIQSYSLKVLSDTLAFFQVNVGIYIQTTALDGKTNREAEGNHIRLL